MNPLRLSWRPAALRMASPRQLGQPLTNNFLVEVVDQSGRPVPGAVVQFGYETRETDGHGTASFSAVGSGPFDVKATYEGLTVGKSVTAAEVSKGLTTFLQFPLCTVGPILRPIDLAIFGTSAVLLAAGSYWKVRPLEMAGEIALGAALFGFIYRLQCL